MRETQVRSLDREDPLEKEMATHSSILAWRTHGRRSLVGYNPWGHRVGKLNFLCQILQLNVSSIYIVLIFLLTETKHLDTFGKATNWYTLNYFAVYLEVYSTSLY